MRGSLRSGSDGVGLAFLPLQRQESRRTFDSSMHAVDEKVLHQFFHRVQEDMGDGAHEACSRRAALGAASAGKAGALSSRGERWLRSGEREWWKGSPIRELGRVESGAIPFLRE